MSSSAGVKHFKFMIRLNLDLTFIVKEDMINTFQLLCQKQIFFCLERDSFTFVVLVEIKTSICCSNVYLHLFQYLMFIYFNIIMYSGKLNTQEYPL